MNAVRSEIAPLKSGLNGNFHEVGRALRARRLLQSATQLTRLYSPHWRGAISCARIRARGARPPRSSGIVCSGAHQALARRCAERWDREAPHSHFSTRRVQSPAFPGGSTSAACFSGCCSPAQSAARATSTTRRLSSCLEACSKLQSGAAALAWFLYLVEIVEIFRSTSRQDADIGDRLLLIVILNANSRLQSAIGFFTLTTIRRA